MILLLNELACAPRPPCKPNTVIRKKRVMSLLGKGQVLWETCSSAYSSYKEDIV